MPGPRPGSQAYDVQRARWRKHLEGTGKAADNEASQRGREGVILSERGLGPTSER
jgi:hypothetical protein